MRDAWTDERLDDLNDRVTDLGRRMDEGFNRVHGDIRSLNRLILQVGGGMIATFVVGFLGVVATQL